MASLDPPAGVTRPIVFFDINIGETPAGRIKMGKSAHARSGESQPERGSSMQQWRCREDECGSPVQQWRCREPEPWGRG